MTEEDIKYRQGRSKKQYSGSGKMIYWTFLLLILGISLIGVYNLFS